MSANTTKDGVEVKAGQVWRDSKTGKFYLIKTELGPHVQVVRCNSKGHPAYIDHPRKSYTIHRFDFSATGWELVTT